MADKTMDLGTQLAATLEGSGINPNAILDDEGTVSDRTQEDLHAEDGLEDDETEAGQEAEGTASSIAAAHAEVESKNETGTETEAPEAAATEGTEDVPDRYFEVDLSSVPAEERKGIIAALRERDDEIGKLLRGRSEDDRREEPAAPPEEPTPVSDEDILRELGLDPENPFDENASKVAVPLVRALQGMKSQLDQLTQERELEALESTWNSTLDKLEKENGELPVDRVAVLEFAADNGILRPEDAYWRIAGPAKRQVEQALAEAQKRLAPVADKKPSKTDVTTLRPRSSSATEEVPAEGKTVREAVASQAGRILRDLGIG